MTELIPESFNPKKGSVFSVPTSAAYGEAPHPLLYWKEKVYLQTTAFLKRITISVTQDGNLVDQISYWTPVMREIQGRQYEEQQNATASVLSAVPESQYGSTVEEKWIGNVGSAGYGSGGYGQSPPSILRPVWWIVVAATSSSPTRVVSLGMGTPPTRRTASNGQTPQTFDPAMQSDQFIDSLGGQRIADRFTGGNPDWGIYYANIAGKFYWVKDDASNQNPIRFEQGRVAANRNKAERVSGDGGQWWLPNETFEAQPGGNSSRLKLVGGKLALGAPAPSGTFGKVGDTGRTWQYSGYAIQSPSGDRTYEIAVDPFVVGAIRYALSPQGASPAPSTPTVASNLAVKDSKSDKFSWWVQYPIDEMVLADASNIDCTNAFIVSSTGTSGVDGTFGAGGGWPAQWVSDAKLPKPTGSHISPDDYYWIIPGLGRTSQDLRNVDGEPLNASGAVSQFITALASPNYGKHFGQFLKSSAAQPGETGFTIAQVTAYRSWIETAIKRAILSGQRTMLGRVALPSGISSGSISYVPVDVNFNIAGMPGVASALLSGAKGGQTSSVAVRPDQITSIRKFIDQAIADKIDLSTTAATSRWLGGLVQQLGLPFETIKKEFEAQFRAAMILNYMATEGVSREVAERALGQEGSRFAANVKAISAFSGAPDGGGGGGGGGRGTAGVAGTGSGNPNRADRAPQQSVTITVTRGLPGYVKPPTSLGDRPVLVQTYRVSPVGSSSAGTATNDAAGDAAVRAEAIRSGYDASRASATNAPNVENVFEFPFAPREVTYSGIGSQWTEIERAGNYPIVEWQKYQLLKISFNFDVVNRNMDGKDGFGYAYSVEDQLRKLREMATAPYPVTFLNMDIFFRDEVRFPQFSRGRGVEFVIAEFSVTSQQRTPYQGLNVDQTDQPHQISRATCSMTLQEIPIETVDIVRMPPITPCIKKKRKKSGQVVACPPGGPSGSPPEELSFVLLSPIIRGG